MHSPQNIGDDASIMPFVSYTSTYLGPSGRIRTCDPLVPNQMRYQTALHSDKFGGDEWIRATDLLRMKEMHYRCATSPKFGAQGETRTLNPFGTGF